MTKCWIVSLNDLEAYEILHLLDACHQDVLISRQPWGASWERLEHPIARQLAAGAGGAEVIGIELAGPNNYGARNIDHHLYAGDDRSSPYSSLEQVARILGVPLSPWQRKVATNDRAYIPGLLREFPGISRTEVSDIRRRDRRAQGLTAADEKTARQDIKRAEKNGPRYLILTDQPPNSAHSDFIWTSGQSSSEKIEAPEDILICSPAEWQYSGPRVGCLAHRVWPERYWSGGPPADGYFCILNPGISSQDTIRKLLEWQDLRQGTTTIEIAPPPAQSPHPQQHFSP